MGGVLTVAAHTAGTLVLRFLVLALNDVDVQNKIYKVQKNAAKALIKASGERAERNLADHRKTNWRV